MELLKETFCQEDVEQIQRIHISCFQRKDRMYWRHSKSGVYTVKTGYALAKQRKKKLQCEKGKHEASTGPRKDKVWKGLWNLNIKHKHKQFLWKCLQEYSRFKNAYSIEQKWVILCADVVERK